MNAAPRIASSALVAIATAISATSARAVTLNYCDFASTAGLTLTNDASKQGSTVELTPDATSKSGSVFTTASFPFDATTSFHTYFRARIGPNAAGGDGIAFVIQSGNANAIGTNGMGLGYAGIGQSFALELDTYDNGAADPSMNHVAVLFDGDTSNHVASASPMFLLTVAQDKYVWIDYDGPTKSLEVYLALGPGKPATPLLTAAVDLDAHLGPNVRAGFTGATGGASNRHQILEWQMSTDGRPCCVAAPAGACAAPYPACGAKGLCVECNGDADCGPGKPRCETGTSTCVSCLSSSDCIGNAPVCAGNACVPCADDADCAGHAGAPACSPTGACVACTTDATCAAPTGKCDTGSHTCVACVSNADCGAAAPACALATHTCAGCVDDSPCAGAKPVCDTGSGTCVAGCHVVSGKDTCAPGMICDAQDGSIGACQPTTTSSSSSGMASSSGGGAGGSSGSGGAIGTGGTMPIGGAGGKASSGGAGGAAVTPPLDTREGIGPGGAGCWCATPAGSNGTRGTAATALLVALFEARRRRRAARRCH